MDTKKMALAMKLLNTVNKSWPTKDQHDAHRRMQELLHAVSSTPNVLKLTPGMEAGIELLTNIPYANQIGKKQRALQRTVVFLLTEQFKCIEIQKKSRRRADQFKKRTDEYVHKLKEVEEKLHKEYLLKIAPEDLLLYAIGHMAIDEVLDLTDDEFREVVKDFMEKESRSWDRTEREGPKKAVKYSSLVDIFQSKNEMDKCIQVLSQVSPPIIDEQNNYLLGERGKSAIAVWVKVLLETGKIQRIPDNKLSMLLNDSFKNLHLGANGRSLRSPSQTAEKRYYFRFTSMLK